FEHDDEVGDPPAPAAVLLRQADAEVAEPPGLEPQLVAAPAGAGALLHVPGAVAPTERADRRAQGEALLGVERECRGRGRCGGGHGWGSLSRTARTAPTATCSPGRTGSLASTPSAGATTTCSIFIASSHSNGCPAVTASPSATATRTTVPGIGATSEPGSRRSAAE